jgi:hypothetical protein
MDSILDVVLGNALVATVLALLAAGSTMALRRPAFTHALWTLVLVKLMTPSFIPVPIPGHAGYLTAESDDVSLLQRPGPVASGGTGALHAAVSPPGPGSSEGPGERAAAAWRVVPFRTAPGQRFPWGRVIFWLELLGGLAWFIWVGLRVGRFYGLLSEATPASAELVREVERWAERIGLARCPQVLLWRRVAPPVVWSLGRRAKLILPEDFVAQLDRRQLAAVLVHELAHLRRGDQWVRLLEVVATGFYWWHPVVWWSRRELERTEEQACDAWVLWASPRARESYARALLETADFLSRPWAASCPMGSGFGRATFLKRRLAMVIEGNFPRIVSVRGRLGLLALATALLPLAPTGAAGAPSLDEIKAGLGQRRAKIESLYVETVGETTSPLGNEEIGRLPKDCVEKIFAGHKVEYQYAAKGESRFSRVAETDKNGGLWDHARGDNGKYLWDRFAYPNSKGDVQVSLFPPSAPGHLRFLYPNPWLGLVVGEAMTGPNLAAQWPWQDLFYLDFGSGDHQCWTLAASDKLAEVEGVKCAVLEGTIRTTYRSKTGEEKQVVRQVKCWLDVDRGLALRQWEEHRGPGTGLLRVVNSHFEQVEPGLWLPREIELQSFAPIAGIAYPERYRGKLTLSTRIRVTKCKVNRVADDVFASPTKRGDWVADFRKQPTAVPVRQP